MKPAVFALLFWTQLLYAEQKNLTPLCKSVQSCRQAYIANNCESLISSEDAKKNIKTCGEDSIGHTKEQTFEEILKSCGQGIENSVVGMAHKIANLPESISKNIDKTFDADLAAQKICETKLGYGFWEAYDSRIAEMDPTKKTRLYVFNKCVSVESAKILNYHFPKFPNIKELVNSVKLLDQGRRCFKYEVQAKIVCPIAASFIAGGIVGFAIKRSILMVSARLVAKTSKVEVYADSIAKLAKAEKEILSVEHVEDLVDFSKSGKGLSVAKKSNLNIEAMQMGMLDSDFGKIAQAWTDRVFSISPESDELLGVVSGKSTSAASKAMREIMSESGFADKTFLNSDMPIESLREVLKKNPILQGYLHEMPGMSSAIDDFNLGRITKEEFKIRMKANLFHNGPHAGFWGDEFGDKIVPGVLSQGDDAAKKFFSNSVFDRGANSSGIHAPLYPGPVSAEGVFHTFTDRLSQGSRGGMVKIFAELGGKAYEDDRKIPLGELMMMGRPAGLNHIAEVLFLTPGRTERQLEALLKHIETLKDLGRLDSSQAMALPQMVADGQARLAAETKFIAEGITRFPSEGLVKKIELKYLDETGKPVTKVLTDSTPANEAATTLNQFMLAEERLSGDPMRARGGLGSSFVNGSGLGSIVGGTSSLAAAPKSCLGKISDQPVSIPDAFKKNPKALEANK